MRRFASREGGLLCVGWGCCAPKNLLTQSFCCFARRSFGVSEPFKIFCMDSLWAVEESKENANSNMGGDAKGDSVRDKLSYFRSKLGRNSGSGGTTGSKIKNDKVETAVQGGDQLQNTQVQVVEKAKGVLSLKERLAAVKRRSSQAGGS